MIEVIAHPSLALIKYWGKENDELNTAATSSLAVNLEAFFSKTKVTFSDEDEVFISGKRGHPERYAPFFNFLRKRLHSKAKFKVSSENNFPTSSGLASSSSGFAALAFGCAKLIDKETPLSVISEIARLGSASAARAVFPGFVALQRGALEATPLFPQDYWPNLRIVIATISESEKPLSSREAMKRTKATSPFYAEWVNLSVSLFAQALTALNQKNFKALGDLTRQSTYSMFATQMSATPPILFFHPETIALLKTIGELREMGFSLFETCDAGPQVKIVTLEEEVIKLLKVLHTRHPNLKTHVSSVGGGVREA